jgi:hypothetical protein
MAIRKSVRRWSSWCLAGVGLTLSLTALSGCQTSFAGMTLPSGWYLQHPPQYIRESPRFPLTNELARQEEVANAPGAGAPQQPQQFMPAGPQQ